MRKRTGKLRALFGTAIPLILDVALDGLELRQYLIYNQDDFRVSGMLRQCGDSGAFFKGLASR